MRKKIISHTPTPNRVPEDEWLILEHLATAELSSEDRDYPIEDALSASGEGFRAASPGLQTIRFVFDKPTKIRRIFLLFVEPTQERTQEFVLRWSQDRDTFKEIVRQQWNFNPHNATHQTEDYRVELPGVQILELMINPDVQGQTNDITLARTSLPALVSLAAFRIA